MARPQRPGLRPIVPAVQKRGPSRQNSDVERRYALFAVLLVGGMLIGVFSIAFVGSKTLVSHLFLSKVIAACCAGGLLLAAYVLRKPFNWSRPEAFLIGILTFGPLLAGALMWLNLLLIQEERTETHYIVAQRSDMDAYSGLTVTYRLQDDAFDEYPKYRATQLEDKLQYVKFARAKAIEYQIGTGLFGYDVMLDRAILLPD